MKNIFEKSVTDEVIARIEKLSPETQPQWGKMGVAQMFAHLSVAYEFVYTDKHKATKATGFKKFMIKLFAKNRNFNALKFSKQIITYLIIFPLIIFFSFIGLVSTKINEKPIYEIVITYYNNTFNNEEKPNNSSKGKGLETSKKAYRRGYSDGQTGYGLPASSRASAYEFYTAKRYNYSEEDYKVYVMGYNDGLYEKTKKY